MIKSIKRSVSCDKITTKLIFSFAAILCYVHTPHYLDSPLEVETLLDDLSEPHLGHVLGRSEVDFKNIPDVVCVLDTCQLRDACRSHLVATTYSVT